MPIKQKAARPGPVEKRPWSTMDVGATFNVPAIEAQEQSIRVSACVRGATLNRRFSVSKADGGVNVTRVA